MWAMISDFLHALGGPTKVAARLADATGEQVSRARVAMWGVKGRVPFRWRADLYRLAAERGITAPEEITEGLIVAAPRKGTCISKH